MATIDWKNIDKTLQDPKISTPAYRIFLALHPDVPMSTLRNFAVYDCEVKVIEAAGLNKKATKEIIKIVTSRLKCTKEEFEEKRNRYTEEVNQKILDNFCPIPWNHVSTNADGTHRMCCQHILKETGRGRITNTEGNLLSDKDDLYENRNAPEWKQIRKEFINGLRPEACKLCWDEEENGIGSRRQWICNTYFDDHDEFITKVKWETKEDGTINPDTFPITYWDLRFGNKCNLKCRSCGPTDSDQWYDDYLSLVGNTYNSSNGRPIKIEIDKHGKGYVPDVFDWYDHKDSKLWNYIINNVKDIERIYFTGGEPTINSKHKELLDILISNNLAPNISLDYNSNVANVPTAIFDQWQHFKEVQIGMSVDGIFEHFEYIRHQGKWKSAFRAMKRLDTDPKLDNIKAQVAFTVSVMNVLHYADMQWWMKEQNWKRIKPVIVVHNLYGPDYLNIQNLPGDIKHYIKKYYGEFLNSVAARWREELTTETGEERKFLYEVRKNCDAIIHHMYDKEPNEDAWNNYVPETKRIDKLRGENWEESLPELSNLIRQYNDKAKRKEVSLQ